MLYGMSYVSSYRQRWTNIAVLKKDSRTVGIFYFFMWNLLPLSCGKWKRCLWKMKFGVIVFIVACGALAARKPDSSCFVDSVPKIINCEYQLFRRACPSVRLSVHLSDRPPVRLSDRASVRPAAVLLFARLPVRRFLTNFQLSTEFRPWRFFVQIFISPIAFSIFNLSSAWENRYQSRQPHNCEKWWLSGWLS